MMRLMAALIAPCLCAMIATPCMAQPRRVQIIATEFKPDNVYQWSPESPPRYHEGSLPRFTLLLTARGTYEVVLQYRGDGQYLPSTSDFRIRVRVDGGTGPISIAAPFNRWNSCNVRAVRSIQGYSMRTPAEVMRAALESWHLLNFKGDAACGARRELVARIHAEARRKLPAVATYLQIA